MIIGLVIGLSVGIMAATGVVAMAMYVAATEEPFGGLRECECCQ